MSSTHFRAMRGGCALWLAVPLEPVAEREQPHLGHALSLSAFGAHVYLAGFRTVFVSLIEHLPPFFFAWVAT